MANAISDTENVASAPSAIPIMRRGLVIAGILLIAANLRASITVVGPLLGEVRTDLDISSTTASALISLPLLCFAVFSPVAPVIAARWGMERTLAAALGMLALAIVIRSVPWMPALWIGTVSLGMSIATMNVLLPALLKRDFPTEAGRLTASSRRSLQPSPQPHPDLPCRSPVSPITVGGSHSESGPLWLS